MTERPKDMQAGGAVRKQRPIPLEDLELLEKIKRGRTEAFSKLVLKYQDRVFNTCWRICGHVEDARDVTQEAFIKAYEGLATFRQESGFYTWVFRIAVNLALTHKRKNRWRDMVSLDQPAGSGTQAEALAQRVRGAREADPADATNDEECAARLIKALQSLEEDHRVVVVLRDIEGFDYHEIAGILDLPVGTVKSRLFRARLALREAVLPYLQ